MPFTPFHFGPALLVGLILFSYLDFPTFMVANVIVDIEPIIILTMGLNLPLHGFFHSFIGGTIASFILFFIMMRIRKFLESLMGFFNLEQNWSRMSIMIAAISGVYLHIVLDSRLYTDIKPFFPSTWNPFYSSGIGSGFEVYTLCVLSGLIGMIIFVYRIIKFRRNKSSLLTS